MTLDEERRTIEKVLGGDKDAFEVLVLANQSNVYNLALKMLRNAEDALDVSQEAFLKAYRQLASFRHDARFSVWLYKLTYNLCLDMLRKSKGKETLPLAYQDDEGEIMLPEIPDTRSLPEETALRKETRKSIASGILELPLKHREILVMREVTDMSYEEIADALSISPGTVKSRLSRARLKLVEILAKKGTFPEGYRHNEQDAKDNVRSNPQKERGGGVT